MIKRPLCVVALGVVMVLLLIDAIGLSQGWKPQAYQALQENAKEGTACQIEGTVRYYERKPKSIYIYLTDTTLKVHSEQYSIKESIIKYEGKTDYFSIGNKLRVDGKLEAFPVASNSGQFDTRKFYHARNIDFFVKSKELEIVDDNYDWLKGTLYQFREKLCTKINILVPRYGGILNAMITGEKMFLDEGDKIRYQISGTYHILSISGSHFAAIWFGIRWLLGKTRMNYYLTATLSGITMMLFGIFVGDNIPAMRALIMILVYLGARFTGRTYDMLSAMALSFALILGQFPALLYDSGFQLSFGAILALGVVYPLIKGEHSKSKTRWRKIQQALGDGLVAGLAIWLVTLPLTLYAFYEVSLWGLLFNLLVVPTSSVVLASGLIGGISSFVNMSLAKVLIFPAQALLYIYDWLGAIIQSTPYATLILGKPQIWQCVVYYLGLIIFLVWWHYYKKKDHRRYITVAPVAVSILLTIFLSIRGHSGLEITALDVGQGDALVIELPTGNHYLVDGGSSSEDKVGHYRIMPYLKSQGIGTLEAVMVTHPDADHLNGIIEMLEAIKNRQTSIRIRQFILPAWMAEDEEAQELRELLSATRIPAVYVKVNDSIVDGEVRFDIVHPSKPEYEDANEGSLTFALRYKEFTGLFTGDLCGAGEAEVTKLIDECQFLKVAHHGSKNSTPKQFLDNVKPKLSIISCSARNPYGHPHPDLLERLNEVDSEIYNTANTGAITISTKGEQIIEISTYKNN